jgi:hypothetical protein
MATIKNHPSKTIPAAATHLAPTLKYTLLDLQPIDSPLKEITEREQYSDVDKLYQNIFEIIQNHQETNSHSRKGSA